MLFAPARILGKMQQQIGEQLGGLTVGQMLLLFVSSTFVESLHVEARQKDYLFATSG